MQKIRRIIIAILALLVGWRAINSLITHYYTNSTWETKGFKRIKRVGSEIAKYNSIPWMTRINALQKEHNPQGTINNMKLKELYNINNRAHIGGIFRGASDSNQTVCEMSLNSMSDGYYLDCRITCLDASVASSIQLGYFSWYALKIKNPQEAKESSKEAKERATYQRNQEAKEYMEKR